MRELIRELAQQATVILSTHILQEVEMTRIDGEVLSYRFSQPEDTSYYVLKHSDLDVDFKVAEYTVNPVKDSTRDKLVQPTRLSDFPLISR